MHKFLAPIDILPTDSRTIVDWCTDTCVSLFQVKLIIIQAIWSPRSAGGNPLDHKRQIPSHSLTSPYRTLISALNFR